MKKRILSILTMLTLVLGVVGCSSTNNAEEELSGNEQFVQTFQESINKRWKKQAELDAKYATLTAEQYTEESLKILEEELATLEAKEVNVEEKDLQSYARNYIAGVKKQIEAKKTTDYELKNQYLKESEKLRDLSLLGLVENYHIKIDAENEQTYKDFKEKALVLKKQVESQDYADDFAEEMKFQKTTNEYGYVKLTTTVENTSDINFTSLSYNVQYKDEAGTVIGNDTIYLSNFIKGSKQNVTLSPYVQNIKSVSVTTSAFTTE